MDTDNDLIEIECWDDDDEHGDREAACYDALRAVVTGLPARPGTIR